ncbi:Hypothetical predicted protein [Marmota monax]|uniref:Carboxylesterase type B domain-containing protein n=1 Tax=Marmota monax TaxID=9995 RepID=A0A5E4A5A8_MARMO|nr:Hypothetical predicted protein [Marmota monax]
MWLYSVVLAFLSASTAWGESWGNTNISEHIWKPFSWPSWEETDTRPAPSPSPPWAPKALPSPTPHSGGCSQSQLKLPLSSLLSSYSPLTPASAVRSHAPVVCTLTLRRTILCPLTNFLPVWRCPGPVASCQDISLTSSGTLPDTEPGLHACSLVFFPFHCPIICPPPWFSTRTWPLSPQNQVTYVCGSFSPQGHPSSPPVVDTVHGKVLGKYVSLEGSAQPVAVFLGVPFAKPPLGPLRFAPPQPAEPWSSVKNTTSYPPM